MRKNEQSRSEFKTYLRRRESVFSSLLPAVAASIRYIICNKQMSVSSICIQYPVIYVSHMHLLLSRKYQLYYPSEQRYLLQRNKAYSIIIKWILGRALFPIQMITLPRQQLQDRRITSSIPRICLLSYH